MGAAPKSSAAIPTPDEICERPALVASLPIDIAQHLLVQTNAKLAAMQTARDALLMRLAAGSRSLNIAEPRKKSRTLDADEIAAALGQERRWVFEHIKDLPFVRRISRKALVADEAELLGWRALQKD